MLNSQRIAQQEEKVHAKALFNFKLEDGLQVLNVGSFEKYFTNEDFTEYENMGENLWALDLDEIKYGTTTLITNKESATDTNL